MLLGLLSVMIFKVTVLWNEIFGCRIKEMAVMIVIRIY